MYELDTCPFCVFNGSMCKGRYYGVKGLVDGFCSLTTPNLPEKCKKAFEKAKENENKTLQAST